jgi:aspartokinase
MGNKTKISVTNDSALITIDKLPAGTVMLNNIFTKLADENINIDMISQTPPFSGEISLSFSLESDNVFNAMKVLNSFTKDNSDINIHVDANSTKISVYGEYMRNTTGIAAKLFKALSEAGVDIKLITTSEVDISILIYGQSGRPCT